MWYALVWLGLLVVFLVAEGTTVALVSVWFAAGSLAAMLAALAGGCGFGLCGELAQRRLGPTDGNASYRNYIIDALYRLTGEALEEGARYEIC